MLRFLARCLGLWLLAAAVIALVVDGARSIAAGAVVATPLGELWQANAPASLAAIEDAVGQYAPAWVWDGVIASLLVVPAFAVAGFLGALLMIAGQARVRPEAQLDLR